jgi:adenylate kinase family enzyme
MRRVFLTSGPPGAGKSTFCEQVIATNPEIVLVSRDQILIAMFGTVWLSAYTGEHKAGWDRMWKIVSEKLRLKNTSIILDCWNGYPSKRMVITSRLRHYSADYVEAWLFTTPQDVCVEWRLQREAEQGGEEWKDDRLEATKKYKAISYAADHNLFHSMPTDETQGFNLVRYIDPTQPLDLSFLNK